MWIVAVLTSGMLILVMLLLIPVDLGFQVAREERSRGQLAVGWMFGLLCKEIEVGRKGRREDRKARRPERDRKRVRSKRSARRLVILARTRGFPHRCLRFFRQLLRQVKIRELRLWGRLGFDDPADTGLLFAALTPSLCCLGAFPAVSVGLEPDFERASLAGRARGTVRLVPLQVLWILVRFLLAPETLRAAWSLCMRRHR